jgi:LEA14-like dessication related protein
MDSSIITRASRRFRTFTVISLRLPWKNKRSLAAIALFSLVGSCAVFEEPDFEFSGVDLGEVGANEVSFTVNAQVENPNWYALKVKKSNVEVLIENKKMGTVFLDNNIKFKRKSDIEHSIPLRATLEKGALLQLMQYSMKDEIQLNIKGKVRAGIFFFSKTFPVDYKRSISGEELQESTEGTSQMGQ